LTSRGDELKLLILERKILRKIVYGLMLNPELGIYERKKKRTSKAFSINQILLNSILLVNNKLKKN